MVDIEKICASICNKAEHYNGCRYMENKIPAKYKLVGFLDGLEDLEIIVNSVINMNYYKRISEIDLTMKDNDQVVNIFISIENRTVDILKKTEETTIIKKVKV